MRVDFSNSSAQTLFVADLEPPAHLFEEARGRDRETDIRLLFTKHNRVAVQKPIVREMTEPIEQETLAALNLRWSGPVSFLVVATTFGCLPDRDCQFTWLRVEYDLGSDLNDYDIRPVVCEMYPKNEEDEIKKITSFEISNQLGLKIKDLEIPTHIRSKKHTTEHSSYRYRITTFGKMSPQPVWDFRTTEVHPEIVGDFTLLLVVGLQSNLVTTGKISVSAEVQLRSNLPKFPLLMKRTSETAADNSFRLSRINAQ